jgi:hypothetical protein
MSKFRLRKCLSVALLAAVLAPHASAQFAVISVSPSFGPTTGGTSVTITGAEFAAPVSVTFGGTAASSITLVDTSTISATTPPNNAGSVDVSVANGDGQQGAIAGGFTYEVPPVPPSTGGIAPAITNSATAHASVGQSFSYSINATGTAPFAYNASNLPPNLILSDNVIFGTPQFAGVSIITITVTNSVGSASLDVLLQVESAGTAPPPASPAEELGELKTSIVLNFAKPGNDKATLQGTLPVPAGFVNKGADAGVFVGGVFQDFTLDTKGSGVSSDRKNTFKLRIKGSKTAVRAQTATFTATLRKGSFAAALVNEGLTDATVTNVQRTITYIVLLNNQAFQTTNTVLYTAKAGRFGRTKDDVP